MKELVNIRLPEPPSANRWWRRAGARMHKSKEALAYQQGAYYRLMAEGYREPAKPPQLIRVDIAWHRGPIKTPKGGSYFAGDLDKRVGILLDALQGVAYVSDAQITELHATRHDAEGGEGYIMLQVFAL